jgi:phospholipase/carboxylesterase
LKSRLTYLDEHGPGSELAAPWPGLLGGVLPERDGSRPQVSTKTPQEQLTQNSAPAFQEELFARLSALPGVVARPSAISVPGARAFALPNGSGPQDAFLVPDVGEFAHLHPSYDGSLHVALPPAMAADVVTKGWGVAHPLAGLRVTPGMVMIFGPRNQHELEVISAIVGFSHTWAES